MYDRVAAEAREQQVTQGDIVAHILSLHYGLPDADPITIKREHAQRMRDRRDAQGSQMRMTG